MNRLFSNLSHDPQSCAAALRGAVTGSLVSIDLETSGLGRHNSIVSVGVLVEENLFILFCGSHELSVAPLNINLPQLRTALAPLAERTDLVAVLHNATFDLGFLKRAGIEVRCQVHDTGLMLMLADSDRTREGLARMSRIYGQPTNYRLKDVILHELNVKAPHFPGAAAALEYRRHVCYLASDCFITRELYLHLLGLLRPSDLTYYNRFIAPVTPLLVRMTNTGVQADGDFLRDECDRLVTLMRDLSADHARRFEQRLDGGDFSLRGWVYLNRTGLRCYLPKSYWVRVGPRRLPPLDIATLRRLNDEASNCRQQASLPLVVDYLLACSLLVRLATLRDNHIDHLTGRIYTSLNDWQASGRISSTKPNLQAIAKIVGPGSPKEFMSTLAQGTIIRSRNALRATEGYTLVAFDIGQADVRCLAHVVESLQETGPALIQRLEQERTSRLGEQIEPYATKRWDHFRPENRKPVLCPNCAANQPAKRRLAAQQVRCAACGHAFVIAGTAPAFNPQDPSRLAEDFRQGGTDFYTTATNRMLGRPPKDKTERNAMKQTILGIVNGMSAAGLAARLSVDVVTAKSYLDKFAAAYPKEVAYIELMHQAAAMTGYCETFAGRRRRVTPHYWMVNEPAVELFLSYRGADKLWVQVVPLAAGRHTLTCWVKSVVDAQYHSPRQGQEIYHHRDGRISQAPYRFFDDDKLVFGLPVRNISWRLIRRVRTVREECRYQGFDKTRRQLANHIFQGSTADVARIMMLRSQPVCQEFQAWLLLQIHDELLFEVPGNSRQVMRFVKVMSQVLEQPPTAEFRVPLVVEPKMGVRFGELREVERWEYAGSWMVRLWRHGAAWWHKLIKSLKTHSS